MTMHFFKNYPPTNTKKICKYASSELNTPLSTSAHSTSSISVPPYATSPPQHCSARLNSPRIPSPTFLDYDNLHVPLIFNPLPAHTYSSVILLYLIPTAHQTIAI
jgi:hypothetical protein